MTYDMWNVTHTHGTHGILNIVSKLQVPRLNSLKDCFVWRFLLYSYLQPYAISFFISFSFCWIFIFIPTGSRFIWYSHLVSTCCGARVYFHLLSKKFPHIILEKLLLFKIPFSKRALWIRVFCQVAYEGILRKQMWNAVFSFKNALLYSLTKCPYSKCPFKTKKRHFKWGHFVKGYKRAFLRGQKGISIK